MAGGFTPAGIDDWRSRRASRITTVFAWLDVVSFLVRGTGGGMMSQINAPRDGPILQTGQEVYMAGVGLQLAFILVFGVAIRTCLSEPKDNRFTNPSMGIILTLLWIMSAVLTLIIVSSIIIYTHLSTADN